MKGRGPPALPSWAMYDKCLLRSPKVGQIPAEGPLEGEVTPQLDISGPGRVCPQRWPLSGQLPWKLGWRERLRLGAGQGEWRGRLGVQEGCAGGWGHPFGEVGGGCEWCVLLQYL